MIPYFCFDKIIVGPITIYTWGIFVALAFLFSYLFVSRESKKQGISSGFICNLTIWVILGMVIGGRLSYIFQFPNKYFFQPLEILKIQQGGLTLFGGVFGVLIAAILYFKLTKTDFKLFWQIADLTAFIAPISIAIGRIGCSLINDHQGAETSLPWGIVWPDGLIRHPVAEYLIISALILFLILKLLKPKLKKPGQLFFSFLFLYSSSRFFLDFTRSTGTPLSDPHYFGLSATQWFSLIVIFATITIGSQCFFKNQRSKIKIKR